MLPGGASRSQKAQYTCVRACVHERRVFASTRTGGVQTCLAYTHCFWLSARGSGPACASYLFSLVWACGIAQVLRLPSLLALFAVPVVRRLWCAATR